MKEIVLRAEYLNGEEVRTIYFGGGTPSLLIPEQLSAILSLLYKFYPIAGNAEITLEANPDDINAKALGFWKQSGINRLSIGIQSFFEEDLVWMNRAHSSAQASECIRLARSAGFDNLSIDLIYGNPTLPDENWLHNLSTATGFGIPHLSCYALTVEPNTALDALIRKKSIAAVSTDDQARQFGLMTSFLKEKGYEQYEISNFSVPGKRSIHNSSYWSGENYLGLGPSAHSFNGISRQWNVANNALYIQALNNGTVPYELETLTPDQRYNEYVMTSLRTIEGTDIDYVEKLFGKKYSDDLLKSADNFISKGWMKDTSQKLILTEEGKLFADGIASELFTFSH